MALDDSENDTVLDTIAFAAIDDLLVLCHSKRDPSNVEWQTWVERERRREHRAVLISTEGGAPNSRQRARAAEAKRSGTGQRAPVALLTDSAVARHVMTAFAWILGGGHPMKVFPRDGLPEAVSWLGANESLDRVRTVVERLHGELRGRLRKAAP